MKKTSCIIFLSLLIVVLSACLNQDETVEGSSEINVKGLENVDVLNSHGRIKGLENMTNFYENMQNGVPSELRIVHYTIEGDPIVTDLNYNGELLEVIDDTTRDKYGSGAIRHNNCSKLIEEVNPINTTYIAVDCVNDPYGMQEILQINYNLSQQDLFEFELKYGLNLENEINTLTNIMKKVSVENGTQINHDYNIAMDVKQEMYKRLVFANYLEEKDLTQTCDTKDTTNYFLRVHINGGQREYQWDACDHSKDGVKFTKIANYIIEQSAEEQAEQPKVTVQGYVLEKKGKELLIGEGLTMLDYQWIKEELQQMDFEDYSFDFTILVGENTIEFNPGDKIQATIEGTISDSKPGRARVKEIKKLELY
ncbi:DUF4362 domain-containing protein [Lysinibacillus telephonicus]|uniref:DUF4362 domain-containing protein n=1 Tax=Lysinibacillus telephonicus TaxID=1714840 RepID=A0A3S0JWE1_9BACI|nr:DUF4362 domain-containing protein [Lysinibacillus telephonicus]RTQ92790.1 DUF4362 domain-containing protein [Lysinibacillus telephonicus]